MSSPCSLATGRYCVAMKIEGARFGHVNVTSRDWRRLADFYGDVFGMEQVGPERDIASADLDRATGLTGRAPDAAPTFACRVAATTGPRSRSSATTTMAPDPETPVPHRAGWGHIALQVPDVAAALEAVEAGGGATFGDVVTMATKDGRRLTWCYATDPDGNIIELQTWHAA